MQDQYYLLIPESGEETPKAKMDLLDQHLDSRKIVSLRNQIIHAYDGISDENIWSVIINHLPKLKTTIQNILT